MIKMNISVCGAGSWGSALAQVLKDRHNVTLWNHDVQTLNIIEQSGENQKYLPGVCLDGIRTSNDLEKTINGAEIIVIAVPTAYLRDFLKQAKNFVAAKQIIVSVAKGLEYKTNLLVTDIIKLELEKKINLVALSGPSHAEEVGEHKPTAIVAASEDKKVAALIQSVFMTPYFRVYVNLDLKGVEIGGAIKNVIAIAAGIVDGLGLGSNSLAALLTRGLVEIRKIGIALGGKEKTFYGLSGLGDLVVTCSSSFSRNRQVGVCLAKGLNWSEIKTKMNQVAEGVRTCKAIHQFSIEKEIDLPICNQVYRVLFENKDPREAVLDLMTREAQME